MILRKNLYILIETSFKLRLLIQVSEFRKKQKLNVMLRLHVYEPRDRSYTEVNKEKIRTNKR